MKPTRILSADEMAKWLERALGLKPGTLARDAPYKQGVFKGRFWDLVKKTPPTQRRTRQQKGTNE